MLDIVASLVLAVEVFIRISATYAVKKKFGWTLFGASSGRRYEKKCAAISRDVSDTSCEEVSVLCSASQEKKENWDGKYVDQVDQDNQKRRSGEELNKSM